MHHTVPQEHLSIIITTSPIRSQPDTQVIDDSINSILAQKSLDNIHIYIICDGAKITEQNKYKSGIITQDRMDNYVEYKKRLHLKYNNKQKYTIIQREYRHGFAENIKYVMEEYAKTDHVMIYQHDHVIEKQIDFYAVMEMMRKYKDNINYVTFMHKSYRTIIPRIISVVEVKKFIVKLIGKQEGYNVCLQMKDFENDIVEYFRGKFGLPLVPLNFWYDKVHIASRRFYLDVIFNEEGHFDPNRGKNMKTISFPEDTFGHCMKYCINEKPEKLLEYGAYILWDEQPVFYHQSGRAFMGEE